MLRSWDVSALLDLTKSKADLLGTGKVDLTMSTTLSVKVIMGVVQDSNNANRQVKERKSAFGGQVIPYVLWSDLADYWVTFPRQRDMVNRFISFS